MAEVLRENLERRIAEYQRAIVEFQGAIGAIEQLIAELFPADIPTMTEGELMQALESSAVEVVEDESQDV